MAKPNNIFQNIGAEIDSFLEQIVSNAAIGKIQSLTTVIASCIVIVIIYKGFEIVYGRTQEPMKTILWDLFIKAVICSICLGATVYISIIVDAMRGLHDWAGGGAGGLYVALDKLLDIGQSIHIKILKNHEYFGGVYVVFFWVGFLIGLLPAFFIVLTTTLTLSILVLITPVAIICLLFKKTQQIFVQWLNMFIANVFTVMFIGFFMMIIVDVMSRWLPRISNNETMMLILYMFILGATMGSFLRLAEGLAKGLAQVSFDGVMNSSIMGSLRSGGAVSGVGAYGAYKYGQYVSSGWTAPGGRIAQVGENMGRQIGRRIYRK